MSRRTPGRTRLPSPETLALERRALELRRAKVTYADIAGQLGYKSPSGAYEAVQRALARVSQGNVEEYRREEVDMLDRLHLAHWTAAVGSPGAPADPAAAKVILAIAERRARLLGLDAAVAIKATITDSVDAQIEELVSELNAIAAAEAAREAHG